MPSPKKPPTAVKEQSPSERLESIGIDTLCTFIATNGAEGNLNRFCQNYGFQYNTVLKWIRASAERSADYERAREDRGDYMADELVSIADEAAQDAVAVARNKLRVDARKWAASKLKPKAYAEKIGIGGADGLAPIQHAYDMSDEALLAIAAKARTDADA